MRQQYTRDRSFFHYFHKRGWANIVFFVLVGQVLSCFLSGVSIFTQELSLRNVYIPMLQLLPHYVLLGVVYLSILKYKTGSVRPGMTWQILFFYFLAAFVDTQANFLTLLCYEYIAITTVVLLNCFSMPMSGILAYIFFDARAFVFFFIIIIFLFWFWIFD